MFVVQGVSYFNLTLNYRAIAHEQYPVIGITDGFASLFAFFIVRRFSKAENYWGLAGAMVGGSLAGLLGTYLSRTWG